MGSRLRFCWLTAREAREHDRRAYNVREGVLLGWVPYRIRVMDHGTSWTAFHRAREFRAWLRREGLRVGRFGKNSVGVRCGTLEVIGG